MVGGPKEFGGTKGCYCIKLCPLKFRWGPNTLGPPRIIIFPPQIQFLDIITGHANSILAEMVYLCTTFVVDPICRDLRPFRGTSLDHKFLVEGTKSIYRAGCTGIDIL